MKFWTFSGSDSNNVIMFSDENSLVVGSADTDNLKTVEKQLATGKSPAEVFGADDLTVLPFMQIQSIQNRNTDLDLNIAYKAKKEIQHFEFYFDDENQAQACLDHLETVLPEQLNRKTQQQSALAAAAWPILSLVLCLAVSFLFFDKLRWAVYIVGGLWAAFALFRLYDRVSNPPKLTSWTIKGKHARKAWNGAKAAGSYAFIAMLAIGVSTAIPDAYGTSALYNQMYDETLAADEVQKYVSRGADLNYSDENGYNSLMLALDWSYYDVAEALVDAGIDLGPTDQYDISMLEYALQDGAPDNVIQAILKKGGLAVAEKTGFKLDEFVDEYGDDSIFALIDEQ